MERLRTLWLPVVAAAVLLAAIGTAVLAQPTQALKCDPVCLPEEEAPPEEEAEPAPGPRKPRVLVVNVGWGTGTSLPDAPLQPHRLQEEVDYINGYVNEWFVQSAPPGTFPGWTATAGGSYTIREPNLPAPCTQDEEASFLGSVLHSAHEKLERAGIDYTRYNLVLVTYSQVFCFLGLQVSNRMLIPAKIATIHELGHFLGLATEAHPERLACKDANGKAVSLSNDCKAEEFGDPFEEMSQALSLSFNAVYAKQLGWLNGQFLDVKAPATGTWTIRPFIGAGFSERAIRLQDGPTTLWIEYRRPIGIDGHSDSPLLWNEYGSGVFIRREASVGGEPVSQLLDMTPATGIRNRPALEVGRTWANPLGETTITVDSATASGATITIGSQRTQTVPNLIGLDPDRAAALIAGAGLRSSGWTPVVDLTCNLEGVVATQQPLPGTKAFPDSEVRFQVGERDPEIPCQ
jgi:hypothetical protein